MLVTPLKHTSAGSLDSLICMSIMNEKIKKFLENETHQLFLKRDLNVLPSIASPLMELHCPAMQHLHWYLLSLIEDKMTHARAC